MKPPKAMKLAPVPKVRASTSGEARLSTKQMHARALRRRRMDGRLLVARAAKLEAFGALVGEERLVEGDSLHVLSRGHFDTVTIPVWIAREVAPIRRLSASSLTISRGSVLALEQLDGDGVLDEARVTVQDLTMSRSEHRAHIEAVRAWMHADTPHRLVVAETHAKVLVVEFHDPEACPIVVEASANLSSNDNRLEQYAIHRDRELAGFHLEWLDEIFSIERDAKHARQWFPNAKPITTIAGRAR